MPQNYNGTGRRKTSVARVFLQPGSGSFTVNDKAIDAFFTRSIYKTQSLAPLRELGVEEKIDIKCFVKGGGNTGQAGAIRLGVSRALVEYNPEFRLKLRAGDYLTRDPREVERKKYGQKGARGRFQYSKR